MGVDMWVWVCGWVRGGGFGKEGEEKRWEATDDFCLKVEDPYIDFSAL